jgi:hypothetical protein
MMIVIVDNPDLGIVESNLKCISSEHCQHLVGDKPGEYSCALHNRDYYDQLPCYDFGQIEQSVDTPCRLGEYYMKKV